MSVSAGALSHTKFQYESGIGPIYIPHYIMLFYTHAIRDEKYVRYVYSFGCEIHLVFLVRERSQPAPALFSNSITVWMCGMYAHCCCFRYNTNGIVGILIMLLLLLHFESNEVCVCRCCCCCFFFIRHHRFPRLYILYMSVCLCICIYNVPGFVFKAFQAW